MTDREEVHKGKWRSWQLCRSQKHAHEQNYIKVERPKQTHTATAIFIEMVYKTFYGFIALGFTCGWFIAVHNATLACLTATLRWLLMGPLVNETLPLAGWPAYVRNSSFTPDNRLLWEKPTALITTREFSQCVNKYSKTSIRTSARFAGYKTWQIMLRATSGTFASLVFHACFLHS